MGLFVGFFLAAVLAAWLFFPKEKLRRLAESKATEAAGVPVKIGTLGLNFFPIGVSLGHIQVGEEGKTSGIPFVQVKELEVGVQLFPLIKKQLKIDYIRVDEPRIILRLSNQQVPKTEEKKAPDQASSSQDYSLSLSKLSIKNADIKVKDEKGELFLHVGKLNETLSAEVKNLNQIDLEGLLSIGTLLVYMPGGALGQGLTFELDKKISYNKEQDDLKILRGKLKFGDLPLELAGAVKGATREDVDIDATLKGGPANVKSILAYLPAKLFPQVEGVSSEGILSLHSHIKGVFSKKAGFQKSLEKTLDFLLSFSLQKGRLTYPKLPKPIRNIEIAIEANPKHVEIAKFQAATELSSVDVKGRVYQYLTKPSFDLLAKLSTDLIEAQSMQPKSSTMSLSGKVAAEVKAKGSPDHPLLSGFVDLKSVGYHDPHSGLAELKGLTGKMALSGEKLSIDALRGNFGQSDFTIDGKLSNYSGFSASSKLKPSFSVSMRSVLLNLDELIPKESAPKEKGKTDLSMLEKVSGDVSLNAKKVQFNKMGIQNVVGKARLQDGVFDLREFSLQVFGGGVKLSGLVNMKNTKAPTFDLNLGVQKIQAGELLSYSSGLNQFGKMAGFLTGQLTTSVDFKGELDESMNLKMNKLNSKGTLEIADTKLSNHPVQNQLASFLDAPSLKSFSLKNWTQPFEVKDGKLNVENMKLGHQDFQVAINGWQALDGSTKMAVDLDLPQKWAQGIKKLIPDQAANLLFDAGNPDSKIELPLELTGQITSPSFGVNKPKLTASVENRLKQKLKNEQDKLQQKAVDKAENVLKEKAPADLKKALKKLF